MKKNNTSSSYELAVDVSTNKASGSNLSEASKTLQKKEKIIMPFDEYIDYNGLLPQEKYNIAQIETYPSLFEANHFTDDVESIQPSLVPSKSALLFANLIYAGSIAVRAEKRKPKN